MKFDINRFRLNYENKIKKILFLIKETQTYQRLKFLSVTASEQNPSQNVDKYIERSFILYAISPIFIAFGIVFGIIGSLTVGMLILPIVIILFLVGLLEFLRPYMLFSFMINSDFGTLEKNLFENRYVLIRTMYYNSLMYGDPLAIDDSVKANKSIYTFFKFLSFDERTSYDKLDGAAAYFTNVDLQKFIKELSAYMKDQSIKRYYEEREMELETKMDAVINEKATTYSSLSMILVFMIGIGGLMLGIASIVQPLMTQIYTKLMANFSGGMLSQVSSELVLFQMIIGLPPVYYAYILIFILSIFAAYIMSMFSKKVIE